jgi:PKHD-type hydroxylase
MQYVLTPYAQQISSYVWWEGAFTEQELNWLQGKARESKQDAVLGAGAAQGNFDPSIRRSKTSWISNTSETQWVFEKLGNVASKLNANHFRFDLIGFGEQLQLTHYDQSENGMYGWHQDYGGNGVSRKLSLVLQLSDPSEYEGGNLQVQTGPEPQNVKKQRGLIAAFPSYVLHQVTPVTQGTRQSLVAWVSGPPFK